MQKLAITSLVCELLTFNAEYYPVIAYSESSPSIRKTAKTDVRL